jgi:hypothetical protein
MRWAVQYTFVNGARQFMQAVGIPASSGYPCRGPEAQWRIITPYWRTVGRVAGRWAGPSWQPSGVSLQGRAALGRNWPAHGLTAAPTTSPPPPSACPLPLSAFHGRFLLSAAAASAPTQPFLPVLPLGGRRGHCGYCARLQCSYAVHYTPPLLPLTLEHAVYSEQ